MGFRKLNKADGGIDDGVGIVASRDSVVHIGAEGDVNRAAGFDCF